MTDRTRNGGQHACGFALAVDLIRSEAGLINGAPEVIEAERHSLDMMRPGRTPTVNPQDALGRVAERIKERAPRPSLDDFAARALRRMDNYPVQHHPVSNPVVEHRRIRTT
ncbi:MAG: hypothetical protein WBN70_08035 [Polyangiales bacterium]